MNLVFSYLISLHKKNRVCMDRIHVNVNFRTLPRSLNRFPCVVVNIISYIVPLLVKGTQLAIIPLKYPGHVNRPKYFHCLPKWKTQIPVQFCAGKSPLEKVIKILISAFMAQNQILLDINWYWWFSPADFS